LAAPATCVPPRAINPVIKSAADAAALRRPHRPAPNFAPECWPLRACDLRVVVDISPPPICIFTLVSEHRQ
jgi:hypothetical protein